MIFAVWSPRVRPARRTEEYPRAQRLAERVEADPDLVVATGDGSDRHRVSTLVPQRPRAAGAADDIEPASGPGFAAGGSRRGADPETALESIVDAEAWLEIADGGLESDSHLELPSLPPVPVAPALARGGSLGGAHSPAEGSAAASLDDSVTTVLDDEVPFDERATHRLRRPVLTSDRPVAMPSRPPLPPPAGPRPSPRGSASQSSPPGGRSALLLGTVAALVGFGLAQTFPVQRTSWLDATLPSAALASLPSWGSVAPPEDAPRRLADDEMGITIDSGLDPIHITLAAEGEALRPVKGPFPRKLELAPGAYTLVASKSGYRSIIEHFEITETKPQRSFRLNLSPVGAW